MLVVVTVLCKLLILCNPSNWTKKLKEYKFCVDSSGFKLTFDVTRDNQSVGAKEK